MKNPSDERPGPVPGAPVILVAEDDPADQTLIGEAFAQHAPEYGLMMVSDGEQALEFLDRQGAHTRAPRPKLILLDLNMPKYDGRQVLERIKNDDNLRSIPVVIFTTSARAEDISDTYGLHANAYVTKPLDYDDFAGALRQITEFFTRTARLPHWHGPA